MNLSSMFNTYKIPYALGSHYNEIIVVINGNKYEFYDEIELVKVRIVNNIDNPVHNAVNEFRFLDKDGLKILLEHLYNVLWGNL